MLVCFIHILQVLVWDRNLFFQNLPPSLYQSYRQNITNRLDKDKNPKRFLIIYYHQTLQHTRLFSDHSSTKTSKTTSSETASSEASLKSSLERVGRIVSAAPRMRKRSFDGHSVLIKAHEIFVGVVEPFVVHGIIKGIDGIVPGTRREYQRVYVFRRLIDIGIGKDATIWSHIFFLSERVLHVPFVNQIFWRIARLNWGRNERSFLSVRLALSRWNGLVLLLALLRLVAFFAEKLFESESIVLDDSRSVLVRVYDHSIRLRRSILSKNSYYIFSLNCEPEVKQGCLFLALIPE